MTALTVTKYQPQSLIIQAASVGGFMVMDVNVLTSMGPNSYGGPQIVLAGTLEDCLVYFRQTFDDYHLNRKSS